MNKSLLASCRALFLAAAFAATAVLAGVAPAEAAASKLKILFGTPPTTYAIPYYLTIDKGWFKDMDLEVEDIHLIGSSNSLRALISGSGDVVLVGPSSTMLSIQGGSGVKVIGSWQPRVDYQLIGSRKMKVAKIEDIPGKTMAGGGGIGMLNHMTSMILKRNGLDPKVDFVAVGGHADRLAAVVAGKADYALVNTVDRRGKLTPYRW